MADIDTIIAAVVAQFDEPPPDADVQLRCVISQLIDVGLFDLR